MKRLKLITVLLALLLAGMVMVPMVSAGTPEIQKYSIPILKENSSLKNTDVSLALSPAEAADGYSIPTGSIIRYSKDGITRVFDSSGKQILTAVDEKSAKITTPEGLQPATKVHAVPQGGMILDSPLNKNTTYVLNERGDLILTVIDDASSMNTVSPLANLVGGWIVWAKQTVSQISYLQSTWQTPTAPTQMTTPFSLAIFNGLENSNVIIQPVLEYNYGLNNRVWTMASWRFSGSSSYYSPRLSVNQGDTIRGTLQYTTINGQTGWQVTTADVSRGTSTYYFTNVLSTNTNLEIVNTLEIAQSGTTNPYDMCGNIIFNNVNIPAITLIPGYTTVSGWYGLFNVGFSPNPTQVTLYTP